MTFVVATSVPRPNLVKGRQMDLFGFQEVRRMAGVGTCRRGQDQMPLQVTKQGGFAAQESRDGKTLYYSKNLQFPGWRKYRGLWKVPWTVGARDSGLKEFRPGMIDCWGLTGEGIYLLQREHGHYRLFQLCHAPLHNADCQAGETGRTPRSVPGWPLDSLQPGGRTYQPHHACGELPLVAG